MGLTPAKNGQAQKEKSWGLATAKKTQNVENRMTLKQGGQWGSSSTSIEEGESHLTSHSSKRVARTEQHSKKPRAATKSRTSAKRTFPKRLVQGVSGAKSKGGNEARQGGKKGGLMSLEFR